MNLTGLFLKSKALACLRESEFRLSVPIDFLISGIFWGYVKDV
jgi:hypothetical protein